MRNLNKLICILISDLFSNTSAMGSSLMFTVILVLSCSVNIIFSLELATYPLPRRLYGSRKYVTVSGTETGGIVAQHMQFAHSKYIRGCAVYSSTFYRCGPPSGNTEDFRAACTRDAYPSPYKFSLAISEIQSYDTTHIIDSLKYMRYGKLYVYCGLQNAEFSTDQQLSIVALYEKYLASPYLIYTRVQDTYENLRVIDADDPESATCPKTPEEDGTVSPNCTSLSAPSEALGFLLGEYMHYINPFYPHFRKVHLEPLRTFNQTEFLDGLDNTGLDESGYYYVPRYCHMKGHSHRYNYGYDSYSRPCFVHVYYHGCNQGREFQGTYHVMNSNYLEIAELNNIIMLFPQALSSASNPGGCFDYVGFTGIQYATKNGPQIQAVWRMLERLLYLMPEFTTNTYYRARSGGGGANPNVPNTNYREQKYNPEGSQYTGGTRPPYFLHR